MRSICEADVTGKRVLVRADLDAPLEHITPADSSVALVGKHNAPALSGVEGYRVTDDFRIRACLPTLKYLVDKGAKVIICGHLGRPGGKVVDGLRMDPVGEVLAKFCSCGACVAATEHCGVVRKAGCVVGSVASEMILEMREGDILLLENLRFHPGEEANDSEFAQELAGLADIYVNECFATVHRAHASIVGVPKLLPAYVGLRLEREVETLSKVREDPARPLVFVMGGAKTETKVPLVREISKYADRILLGGRLMFEKSLEDIPNVVFPIDDVDGFDIGPKTIELFKNILGGVGTVVWNGPLGKFEDAKYVKGTFEVAKTIAETSVDVVVGGGDTLAALKQFGLQDKMSFVSTGGGAMLAFLAGENLPGIEVLE